MKKIKNLLRTINDVTRPYDVAADHPFGRQSIAEQAAIGKTAFARETAERARQAKDDSMPVTGPLTA